jgi:flagellar basal-body rod protein FlgC
MLTAMNTALSALGAYLKKQDVTANNIANVNTADYKKGRADFEEMTHGGVTVTISRIETPGNPLPPDEVIGASHQMSNVGLEEELVELITTQYGFEANAKTLETQEELQGSLLDILA